MASDEVHYIDTPEALAAWVDQLQAADVIAVDTESDSFHRYREKVCLVQMTALGRDVIIDPLAIGDLSALGPVFACTRRVKIFHDAGYDLLCLQRDHDFTVANIFDTMLAARITGSRHFGLAAMLQQYFGFAADKRHQRSDWSKRPLTPAQLDYARHDTHFLPRLREILLAELARADRLTWAVEEFARLPQLAAAARRAPRLGEAEGFWRVHGVKHLDPAARGRLRELYQARERIAERLDRPAFKVLGDGVLMDIAERDPKSLEELAPGPGLRRHAIDRHGPQLLAALANATPVTTVPPRLGRRRRGGRALDPEAKNRYEALREVRRREADALGLEPEVVLGNAVLEELARVPPTDRGALLALDAFRGWRGNALADGFYACVQGFARLRAADGHGAPGPGVDAHGEGEGADAASVSATEAPVPARTLGA